jgi:DNA polymerase-3 subunit epsilon
MQYAIVDIETTGGHASANGITEVAIYIHDGISVIERYETLINPGMPIPYYIRGLTGISDAMVKNAPEFSQVANKIYSLLRDRVFVAHSVNFDYSFLKHALAECGHQLNSKKLCTVRLSRKIFPGIPSYSLGNLCGYLNIPVQNRHRAGGDAAATVTLLELLLQNDRSQEISKFLKRNSGNQALPPNVPATQFAQLPNSPGVYYFHNQKGKIVYVGKAKNIKKRVTSHFSNNSPNKQKQDFMRNIYGISHEVCGNELMALILESHQIKHLWPEFNRSQKRFEPVYGIIQYTDQRGLKRLAIERMKNLQRPLLALSTYAEGHSVLQRLVTAYELCPRLAGIATSTEACNLERCACNSPGKKNAKTHDKKIQLAITDLSKNESFVIVEHGRTAEETAVVLVDQGKFKKMGYLPYQDFFKNKPDISALEKLPLYRENFNIRQIIASYCERNPENVLPVNFTA